MAGGKFFTTVKEISDGTDTLGNKIMVIERDALNLSTKVNELLSEQGKLQREFERANIVDEELLEIYGELVKSMAKVDEVINNIERINERVTSAEERHDELEIAVTKLSTREGTTAKIVESGLKIANGCISLITLDTSGIIEVGKTLGPIAISTVLEIKDVHSRVKKIK